MLQPASQSRIKRYRHQVFAKLTDEQRDGLTALAKIQNKKPAEVIRDLIQAAISGRDEGSTLCLELIQAMRLDVLSVGNAILNGGKLDVVKTSRQSEDVATAELAGFKERRARRTNLVALLRREA